MPYLGEVVMDGPDAGDDVGGDEVPPGVRGSPHHRSSA